MTVGLQGSKMVNGEWGQFFCQISAVRAAEKGGNLSTGEKRDGGCNLLYLQGLFRLFADLRGGRKCAGLELGDLGETR